MSRWGGKEGSRTARDDDTSRGSRFREEGGVSFTSAPHPQFDSESSSSEQKPSSSSSSLYIS